jgi:hypothetical protein
VKHSIQRVEQTMEISALRKPSEFYVIVSLSMVAFGCSAQAERTYRGESLARFHITSSPAAVAMLTGKGMPEKLDVGIMWASDLSGLSDGNEVFYRSAFLAGDIARGTFPEQFQISIYTTPPDEILSTASNLTAFDNFPSTAPGRFLVGGICASKGGLPFRSLADYRNFGYEHIVGARPTHFVVYIDRDADVTAPWAKLFGGPLHKGYNLSSRETVHRS